MSKASQLSLCPPTHFAHSLVTLLSCLIGVLDNPVVAYENGEGTTSNDHPITLESFRSAWISRWRLLASGTAEVVFA